MARKPAAAEGTGKAPAKGALARRVPFVDTLSLTDLARGVLAREIRPRVGQVRRLAEAALAAEEKRARKAAKKDGGKKRKLAKIPGQKGKK